MARASKSLRRSEHQRMVEAAQITGEQYATDQIASEHFAAWVRDQMLEASQADPSAQLPLETKADARVIAKNMLQQLEWDTKQEIRSNEISKLISATGNFSAGGIVTQRELDSAFYDGFRKACDTSRDWLTDELLTIKGEMGGRGMEARRSAPKHLRYSDDQVRAMLAQASLWREQLLVAAKERGWDRSSVVPMTEVFDFLNMQLGRWDESQPNRTVRHPKAVGSARRAPA